MLVDSTKTLPGALVLEVDHGVWSLPPSVQFRFPQVDDQTIRLSLLYHDFENCAQSVQVSAMDG